MGKGAVEAVIEKLPDITLEHFFARMDKLKENEPEIVADLLLLANCGNEAFQAYLAIKNPLYSTENDVKSAVDGYIKQTNLKIKEKLIKEGRIFTSFAGALAVAAGVLFNQDLPEGFTKTMKEARIKTAQAAKMFTKS